MAGRKALILRKGWLFYEDIFREGHPLQISAVHGTYNDHFVVRGKYLDSDYFIDIGDNRGCIWGNPPLLYRCGLTSLEFRTADGRLGSSFTYWNFNIHDAYPVAINGYLIVIRERYVGSFVYDLQRDRCLRTFSSNTVVHAFRQGFVSAIGNKLTVIDQNGEITDVIRLPFIVKDFFGITETNDVVLVHTGPNKVFVGTDFRSLRYLCRKNKAEIVKTPNDGIAFLDRKGYRVIYDPGWPVVRRLLAAPSRKARSVLLSMKVHLALFFEVMSFL